MKESPGANKELLEEISALKQKIQELEQQASQHKQMEDVLRESELKYRSVVEYSSDAIFCVDEKGEYKFANSLFASTFGKSPDYFIGKTFWDIYPKEHADQRYAVTKRVFLTGRSESVGVEVPLPDKTLYFNATADPIKDEKGKVILTVVHAADITDRKAAESQSKAVLEALRKSEASLEDAQHIARIGSWDWDMISNTVEWSKEMYRVFGISPDTYDGKPESLLKVIHPDDLERFTKTMKSNLSKGDPTSLEFRVIHKSGSIHHIFAAGRVEFNDAGRPIRNIGTAQDITERKQVEEAHRESEENFRLLYETSPIGIEFFDTNGRLVHANPASLTIFGLTSENPVRGFKLFADPNVSDTHKAALHRGEPVRYNSQFDFEKVHKLSLYPTTRRGIIDLDVIIESLPGSRGYQVIVQDITEQKQAENALRESEEKFSRAFDTNPIPSAISTVQDGRFFNVNDAFLEKLSFSSKAELIGKTSVELGLYADPQERQSIKKVLKETGRFQNMEVKLMAKDGRILDFLFSAEPIFVSNKQSLLTTAVDVTARKQAEKALQNSEAKYQFLAESMANVVFTVDMNMATTYVSPSIERILGFTPEERMAQKVDQQLTLKSQQLMFELLAVELSGDKKKGANLERSATVELEYYHKDGSIKHLETYLRGIRDAKGNLTGFYGSGHDITERKQMEESLRKREELYQLLADHMKDSIWLMDTNFKITYLSPSSEKLWGYTLEEIIKLPLHKTVTPASFQHATDFFTKEMPNALADPADCSAHSLELEYLRKDGSSFWAGNKFSIVRDENGKPIFILGEGSDITARKRAEEEKQILEERVQGAEKLEALGLLAGGVAHDLNNVLGIVVGYAEMLLGEIDKKSPLREDVVTIMDGGKRAAAIVEDMLTITRRGVAGRKVLNLNKIIGDFKKSPMGEKLLSSHPAVQITTALDPDLLNISGSSVHLDKILFNLVSNASEAMPKGGTLTIKTTNQYLDKPVPGFDNIREGDHVVLSISDTGEGISETDIKRIFEPFYTKKIMGRSGTGLGLSLVWGTVKDHQGYINVQSEKGKGTTFTLYFPVIREDITAEALAVSMSEYMGNGESILVVDDVKKQRDLAARMLKSLKYNVASAASGEDAVEYLKEHKIDLLVVDMIMDPGMDGLDTYKSILKINPKQKAIIVSGFSESDRVHDAHALGAGEYVKKPYVIEKLGMAVKNELARKRGRN